MIALAMPKAEHREADDERAEMRPTADRKDAHDGDLQGDDRPRDEISTVQIERDCGSAALRSFIVRSGNRVAFELGEGNEGHDAAAVDVGARDGDRVSSGASSFTTLSTRCAPGGPTGMTIMPPELSCCSSGGGTWSMPQVTMILSKGPASSQP